MIGRTLYPPYARRIAITSAGLWLGIRTFLFFSGVTILSVWSSLVIIAVAAFGCWINRRRFNELFLERNLGSPATAFWFLAIAAAAVLEAAAQTFFRLAGIEHGPILFG